MSIDATTSLNNLTGLGSGHTSSPQEPPAQESEPAPSGGAATSSPANADQSSPSSQSASGTGGNTFSGGEQTYRQSENASADSIIQAMLAATDGNMPDGKLPLEFSVDPTILTKEVARKMAEKLQRTIEETLLLEKMRVYEAASAPSEGAKTSGASGPSADRPSNAYDVIRTSAGQ